MLRRVIFTAAFSVLAIAYTEEPTQPCDNGKQYYRTSLRHIESGGIGYEYGYTTFQAFLATDPNKWPVTPFLDARGHVFNNGKWAANVGVGLRSLWKSFVYGLNAYYDYRKVTHFQANQIGIGLEALGEFFDFRINGYLPVSTKVSAPYNTKFDSFSGHFAFLSQKYEFTMKGADAELGMHIKRCDNFDCYAAAGPYYFIGSLKSPTWGGKARVGVTYRDILSLEISDSYDRTFHNKFQGQIGINFSFGPKSKVKDEGRGCKVAQVFNDRMLQSVGRQEIIVVDKTTKKSVAIDPATNQPYFFVFVNNTSNSSGTYESPYHSLAQAQDQSSPNDIVYVYPGDGTTQGMDSGITLQANQKLWGSNLSYLLPTTQGPISIPVNSVNAPTITNTNFDTLGHAVTLTTNNQIKGFIIDSPLINAIYGVDLQGVDISYCTIQNATVFAVDAMFSEDCVVSLKNNKFLNNTNGINLTLNKTSTVDISNNTFLEQTSISNVPIEISATQNTLVVNIENNDFDSNVTGSIRFGLTDTISSDITISNNNMLNNDSGAQAQLGSNIVYLLTGSNGPGSLTLSGNTFSGNAARSLHMNDSGSFSTFEANVSNNTIVNNLGAGLVFGTPVTDSFILSATNNYISDGSDSGIAVISHGTTSYGNIMINNNTIKDIGNTASGIAVPQDFSQLYLTIKNNQVSGCEGSGVVCYSYNGIDDLIVDIANNTISHCQNLSPNLAAGLAFEQFNHFRGSIIDNELTDNAALDVHIGSNLTTACLTFSGNTNSSGATFENMGAGTFNLSPCNVDSVNTGTINFSGTIDLVESCSSLTPCP